MGKEIKQLGVSELMPPAAKAPVKPKPQPAGGFQKSRDWVELNLLGKEAALDFKKEEQLKKSLIAAGTAVAGAGTYLAADPAALKGELSLDKLLHAQGSFIGAVTLASLFGFPPLLAGSLSFLGLTLGKEILWDKIAGHGTFDFKDILANLSGAMEAYAVMKAAQKPQPGREVSPNPV